jgi:hypothetical protein
VNEIHAKTCRGALKKQDSLNHQNSR